MVARLLGALNREVTTIHHAAYLLAGASFLSQVLALVRDRIFASFYGASTDLDLYYAAFRVPDMMYVAVSALISVSVLIPMLVQKEKEGGDKNARELLDFVLTAYVWLVTIIALGLYVLIPYIIPAIFPSFGERVGELVFFTQILLLSPILLGISNIFSSIVQLSQRFLITALSPIMYNLGIIFGTLFLTQYYGVNGIIYGVIIGAALHAGVQIPYLINARRMPRMKFVSPIKAFREIRPIILNSMPRTLSLSASEIVEFLLVIVAGFFAAGSISIFNLAWNLQSVPLSLIGVSFSVALFPMLSKLYSEQNLSLFREKVVFTLRQVLFFGSIATALSIVLRAQIVRTIFGGGVFDWDATRLTAAAFALFVISLVFQSASLVIVRTWYAYGSTKIPLISNLIGAVCTFVILASFLWVWRHFPAFKVLLEQIFRVGGVRDSQVLILPLAFSVGVFVYFSILFIWLSKIIPGYWKDLIRPVVEFTLGAMVIGLCAYAMLQITDGYIDTTKAVGVFIHGAISGISAIVVGLAFLVAIGNVEAAHILSGLKRRRAVVITENEPS